MSVGSKLATVLIQRGVAGMEALLVASVSYCESGHRCDFQMVFSSAEYV